MIDLSLLDKKFIGCHSIEDLCKNLKKPRKVMLMVMAGPVSIHNDILSF